MTRKVGNSSSKYDYEPWKFEEDIKEKQRQIDMFEDEIRKLFYKDIRYANDDNELMSVRQKAQCFKRVYKEMFYGDD